MAELIKEFDPAEVIYINDFQPLVLLKDDAMELVRRLNESEEIYNYVIVGVNDNECIVKIYDNDRYVSTL